jgi:hypothetical protein
VTANKTSPSVSAAELQKNRDLRIAAMSLHLAPEAMQRSSRVLTQLSLAEELHDAVGLCFENRLFMPTFALLRSLTDTHALGIWFLTYATEEEARDSVAHLSTPAIVQSCFIDIDRAVFDFIFEKVSGTENEIYRDVLHPSIHGDAMHITMRARDSEAGRVWTNKCVFHSHALYLHFLSELAKSQHGFPDFHGYAKSEAIRSGETMNAVLTAAPWLETDEPTDSYDYLGQSLPFVSR